MYFLISGPQVWTFCLFFYFISAYFLANNLFLRFISSLSDLREPIELCFDYFGLNDSGTDAVLLFYEG